jgi:hypothetical protein
MATYGNSSQNNVALSKEEQERAKEQIFISKKIASIELQLTISTSSPRASLSGLKHNHIQTLARIQESKSYARTTDATANNDNTCCFWQLGCASKIGNGIWWSLPAADSGVGSRGSWWY